MTTVSKVFNTDIHTQCQYTHAHTLIHLHTYRDGFIRGAGPPPQMKFWGVPKIIFLIKKFTDIR